MVSGHPLCIERIPGKFQFERCGRTFRPLDPVAVVDGAGHISLPGGRYQVAVDPVVGGVHAFPWVCLIVGRDPRHVLGTYGCRLEGHHSSRLRPEGQPVPVAEAGRYVLEYGAAELEAAPGVGSGPRIP